MAKNKLNQSIRIIGKILAIAFLMGFILLVTSTFVNIFDANQKLYLLGFLLIILYCLLAISLYEFK